MPVQGFVVYGIWFLVALWVLPRVLGAVGRGLAPFAVLMHTFVAGLRDGMKHGRQ